MNTAVGSMRLRSYLSEGANDNYKFKAIIMAGGPGSGKSYHVSKILGELDGAVRVVNIDKAHEAFIGRYSTKRELVDTSKRVTLEAMAQYVAAGLPMIIDSTSANFRLTIHRIQLLQHLGYDVGMIFVDTPREIARQRNSARQRVVDQEAFDALHEKISKHASAYKRMFANTFFAHLDVEMMDDAFIKSVATKSRRFFETPVKNDIGERLVAATNRGNYYDLNVIRRSLGGWFSRFED